MWRTIAKAHSKWLRDSSLPWSTRIRKAFRHAWELLTAGFYLRGVNAYGEGVRTLGRPRIVNQGSIRIGHNVLLRSVNVPVELFCGPQGELEIGDEVMLNYGVSLGAMRRVEIGDRVRVGPYVMIIDTEFHDLYDRERMPEPRPVVIEDDVWIGAKATILPGVRVGRGAVVGVSSVVAGDVAPFTVVVGVPARAVKALDPERVAAPRQAAGRLNAT